MPTVTEAIASSEAKGKFLCQNGSAFDLRAVPISTRERWHANTGHKCDEDAWLKGRAAEQKIEKMTLEIVSRLKRYQTATLGWQGADLTRPLVDGTLHLVDVVDGQSHELLAVKHQVFLPTQAHTERSPVIKQFTKLMETAKHQRYYVVTAGQRCRLHELPRIFRDLHVLLAEFRRLPQLRKEFNGIEVTLRCDEFTMRRDERGDLTFHPHMNLAIHFPYVLGDKKFLRWKQMIDLHFGSHVKDCGQIKDPRELIKYVTKYEAKDGDLGVLDLQDHELAALYEVRKGLKPVQALGRFRTFRRELRESKHKVVSRWNGKEWKLAIVRKDPPKASKAGNNPTPEKNVIVAITEPQPRFSPILRNQVLVRDYDGNFQNLLENRGLSALRNFSLAAQEETEMRAICEDGPPPSWASGSWVHTFTETLEENTADCVVNNSKHDLRWTPGVRPKGEGP